MRSGVSLPSASRRVETKTVSPGLMSLRSPGTACDMGVPGGTFTFTMPSP